MSDEWAVPAGMTPQDNPGQPKDGIGALVKRVRDNAVEMRDRFNNLLKQAGIRVEQDLVRFTGAVRIEGDATVVGTMTSADFDGDLATGDAGTTGWAMNAARAAVGELFLRPGSVGNDSLANPIEVDHFDHTETGFDPPGGAWYTASSVTLTTPAGFTQAVVTAVAFAAIYNTASADTTVHLRALIAGSDGPEDLEGTTAGQVTMLSMFPSRVSGLTSGTTFVVACQTYSVTDFTAHATNKARISGTVLWLR